MALYKFIGDAEDVPKYDPQTELIGFRELVAKFAPKVQAHWGERE